MEDSNPLFSIIVPVYNVEKFLRCCIDSILAQTYSNFELLLIDDGSTDNSGNICDVYASHDTRIKVFHKRNSGVSSARNLGINNASGEWISFIDADDWVCPKMLQILMENIDISDIIFFSTTEFFEDGTCVKYLAKDNQASDKENLQKILLYLKNNKANYPFFGFTWSKIFRKKIIEQNHIRFVNDFALFEDEIFTDDYCRYINSIKVLSVPLYNYRRSSLGLTNNKRKPNELLFLIQKLIDFSDAYTYELLKDYELERGISFLKEAIYKDKNLEFYKEEQILLQKIELRKSITNIGIKLSIIKSFNNYFGKILLNLCKVVRP